MNLSQALRLTSGESIAFTGAGGKTTAIFRLARLLPPPVLVTTTTHLAIDQLALADQVITLKAVSDLYKDLADQSGEVILIIGEGERDERVTGLSDLTLEKLNAHASERGIYLLIEADGSRQHPLKAPANHEPVVPHFVDSVVVMAGLSALGKPITEEWIHRSELFADLVGLRMGDTISPEAIIRALRDPSGGLKGIPNGVRRICLLNQADTQRLQAVGNRIARELIPDYSAVVVSSFLGGSCDDRVKRFADRYLGSTKADGVYAVYEPIGGIILAAGGSERIGRVKQLLSWRGEPLVRHVALAALSSGFSYLVVVLGSSGEDVKRALDDLPLKIVINSEWQMGQSTSVRVGLNALPPEAGGAIFLLADQPRVSTRLVRTLMEKHSTTRAPVIAPIVDGQRGNPVLFDKITFPDLLSLEGDIGGRAIFSRYPVTWIDWHDPLVLQDIDTEEDYKRLINLDQ